MENLFSMWKVREIADKVTNVVMNYTEIEAKVREATNDEAWGPTGAIMQELAHSTFTYEHFPEVMSMLWKRMLQDSKQHWRRTYKALLVLNYLIKNGSERVVTSAREHIYDLRSLENYTFMDDSGKDQGVNIRHKVKELIDFIQDDDKLREERKKAKKNKDKYIGMSSDMVGMKFGSGPESWDNRPHNRNEFNDQDWDDSNSANKYRDRSYDDELDRDHNHDSDGEYSPKVGRTNPRKFKDEARPGSPPPPISTYEKRVNLNLNANITNSPRKTQKPLKKVDLGAAANFGHDVTQRSQPIGGTADLLNDDFDPRAGETVQSSNVVNEFGDFEAVFNNNNAITPGQQKVDDDFADFSSAFSGPSSGGPSLLTSPTTPAVFPNVIAPPDIRPPANNFFMSNSTTPAQPNLKNVSQIDGALPSMSGIPSMGAFSTLKGQPSAGNDLLGDFGGLSIQPSEAATSNNNNSINDALTGGVGLLDNLGDGEESQSAKHGTKGSAQRLEAVTRSATETFVNLSRLTCDADVNRTLEQLETVTRHFPDPFAGKDYRKYAERYYTMFLEELIALFDSNFPCRAGKMYESVAQVFANQHPDLFEASLRVLVGNFEGKRDETAVTACLRSLLESDNLVAAMALGAFTDRGRDRWDATVQLLVTVPNRVANRSRGLQPDFFTNDAYSNLLYVNALRAVLILANVVENRPPLLGKIDASNLATLLSKVAVNFGSCNRDGLDRFIEIVGQLANRSEPRTILGKIFERLDRSATNVVARTCLTILGPREYSITNVLGKNLLRNDDWKYALTKNIPLLTYVDRRQDNLVVNLVMYLGKWSHTDLVSLLTELLSVWADRLAVKRASVEHQLFVSKLIVCAANCARNVGLTEHEAARIKDTTFRGLPVHLESSVAAVRAAGMKTGELVLNFVYKESDERLENELSFDYESMSDQCKKVASGLQDLFDLDLAELYKPKTGFRKSIGELLDGLSNKRGSGAEYIPPERKFREAKNEIVVTEFVKSEKRGITIIDETFKPDSDDEFEPYDISNDVEVAKRGPAYLRDLKETLLETQDPDLFEAGVRSCQKIVSEQLADDDVNVGLEILEILIVLDQRFHVDDFDRLVFDGCVAIVCTYPAPYAEYLCKEIHAEVGKYSMVHRILMLDVLTHASKALANLTPGAAQKDEPAPKAKKLKLEASNASEIVRKRLESKTRYFHTHKFVKRERRNEFANVVGHFFFPLLYGYERNELLVRPLIKDADDFIFLVRFVEALAVIMFCAHNCPVAPRMTREALRFSWFLRFHQDVKVRMAVLNLIATAAMAVPREVLLADFLSELLNIRMWLADLLSPNASKGEANSECRRQAYCTMAVLENILKSDSDED
ncbi:uncharacterized protein LOC132704188 [Cylas formicarius]|uniref:uncharacterized protein LOC132704188 n=1 Tax=Cylas formicarius TaxID=197179 RepID=UPI0029583DDE|nr:uncharacterized protein LOC132704188 [Cylas formicarius]